MVGECLAELVRLVSAAVGHRQAGWALRSQWQDGAPRGTASATNQHPFAGQRHTQVAHDVVDQAHTVEVVGQHAVAVELQGVGRAGHARALGGVGGQFKGLQFERQGHVHATATAGAKGLHRVGKSVQGGEHSGVADVLPGGLGKSAVDLRGFAVGDGVAQHGVTVGHGKEWR